MGILARSYKHGGFGEHIRIWLCRISLREEGCLLGSSREILFLTQPLPESYSICSAHHTACSSVSDTGPAHLPRVALTTRLGIQHPWDTDPKNSLQPKSLLKPFKLVVLQETWPGSLLSLSRLSSMPHSAFWKIIFHLYAVHYYFVCRHHQYCAAQK